jgi:hypothetical protein
VLSADSWHAGRRQSIRCSASLAGSRAEAATPRGGAGFFRTRRHRRTNECAACMASRAAALGWMVPRLASGMGSPLPPYRAAKRMTLCYRQADCLGWAGNDTGHVCRRIPAGQGYVASRHRAGSWSESSGSSHSPSTSPSGMCRGPVTRASPSITTPAPKVTSPSTTSRRQRRSEGAPAGNRCSKSGRSR